MQLRSHRTLVNIRTNIMILIRHSYSLSTATIILLLRHMAMFSITIDLRALQRSPACLVNAKGIKKGESLRIGNGSWQDKNMRWQCESARFNSVANESNITDLTPTQPDTPQALFMVMATSRHLRSLSCVDQHMGNHLVLAALLHHRLFIAVKTAYLTTLLQARSPDLATHLRPQLLLELTMSRSISARHLLECTSEARHRSREDTLTLKTRLDSAREKNENGGALKTNGEEQRRSREERCDGMVVDLTRGGVSEVEVDCKGFYLSWNDFMCSIGFALYYTLHSNSDWACRCVYLHCGISFWGGKRAGLLESRCLWQTHIHMYETYCS